MTKAITYTYSIAQENCKQISLTLCAFCLALTLGYAVNLFRIVSNTVALQTISKENAALDAEVQNLDAQYVSLSDKISPDTFISYGFNTGTIKTFIPRTSSLGRVALVGHEL